MSDGPTAEELHEAVDRTILALLAQAGINEPPVDVEKIARHLGIGHFEQAAKRGRAAVVARGEQGPAQQAWLTAHAVGQRLRAEILGRLDLDPDAAGEGGAGRPALGGESLANLFADRLLVPGRWLMRLGRELGWDLPGLAECFRPASPELIAWRMLDLDEPVAITIVDNDQVSRRRSNAFRIGKALSVPEKRCQARVHQESRPHEVRESGWRVQGWPIHGVDWKREILRSLHNED